MSDLKTELDRLGAALNGGSLPTHPDVARANGDDRGEVVVVIPAGGFGYRMRGATDDAGAVTQKALLPLPNGETLIGRLIRQYAEAGFKQFVALVNYEGQEVEAHVDGGKPWGVDVRCSYDPEGKGSGRTGAMLNAMALGIMPSDKIAVIHNADCPVLRYPGSFPNDLLTILAHSLRLSEAFVATVAMVEGYRYPYTGMSVKDGRVTSVEMYPFIPVPAHTGITVVSPVGLAEIRARAGESKKNFEADMLPLWAEQGRLTAMMLRADQWIAVDDRKAYRVFCQAVEAGEA